jgi:hypothetical protein
MSGVHYITQLLLSSKAAMAAVATVSHMPQKNLR